MAFRSANRSLRDTPLPVVMISAALESTDDAASSGLPALMKRSAQSWKRVPASAAGEDTRGMGRITLRQ